MSTPIVFLDIDGVLHGYGQTDNRKAAQAKRSGMAESDLAEIEATWFYPEQVARLNRITAAYGAAIVVHSSWRFAHSADDLQAIFRAAGIDAPVLGTTETSIHERAASIISWLSDHASVSRYVVLDDEDLTDAPFIGDNAVALDGQVGLTDADVKRAIRLLGGAR